MFRVTIDANKLIDLLEDWFGNVYENVKEDDTITEIRLTGGNDVEITIGEEV